MFFANRRLSMTYVRTAILLRSEGLSAAPKAILRAVQSYPPRGPKDSSKRPAAILRAAQMIVPRRAEGTFSNEKSIFSTVHCDHSARHMHHLTFFSCVVRGLFFQNLADKEALFAACGLILPPRCRRDHGDRVTNHLTPSRAVRGRLCLNVRCALRAPRQTLP